MVRRGLDRTLEIKRLVKKAAQSLRRLLESSQQRGQIAQYLPRLSWEAFEELLGRQSERELGRAMRHGGTHRLASAESARRREGERPQPAHPERRPEFRIHIATRLDERQIRRPGGDRDHAGRDRHRDR